MVCFTDGVRYSVIGTSPWGDVVRDSGNRAAAVAVRTSISPRKYGFPCSPPPIKPLSCASATSRNMFWLAVCC